jgi:hypothetical protein
VADNAAYPLGETVFQWLIERGQPEQQEPTVWLENSAAHPASHKHWTTDANQAAMFPSRTAAEQYIAEELTHPIRGASARAVEHGFMTRAPMTEIPVTLAHAFRDLVAAVEHVVQDSPGTPESVKGFLREVLAKVERGRHGLT